MCLRKKRGESIASFCFFCPPHPVLPPESPVQLQLAGHAARLLEAAPITAVRQAAKNVHAVFSADLVAVLGTYFVEGGYAPTSPAAVRRAIDVLCELGGDLGASYVIQALQKPELAGHARQALTSLGAIAVPELLALSAGADPVAGLARQILLGIGDRAIPGLVNALNDRRWGILYVGLARRAAVGILLTGGVAGVEALVKWLEGIGAEDPVRYDSRASEVLIALYGT